MPMVKKRTTKGRKQLTAVDAEVISAITPAALQESSGARIPLGLSVTIPGMQI
jgi:hypothetical protein